MKTETICPLAHAFEVGALKALAGDVGLTTEYLTRDEKTGDYLNESAYLAFAIYTHALASAWIDVREYLPATSQSILVKDKDGQVAVTFFSESNRNDWLSEKNHIAYWRPLPE